MCTPLFLNKLLPIWFWLVLIYVKALYRESVARCIHHCALLTQIMHDSLYLNKTFHYVATLLPLPALLSKSFVEFRASIVQFTDFVLQGFHFTIHSICWICPISKVKNIACFKVKLLFKSFKSQFCFPFFSKRSWKVATWMQCQKERMSYGRTSKMPWSNDRYCWAATIPAGKSFAIVVRLKVNINVMIATRTTFHELILSLNETRQGKTSQ